MKIGIDARKIRDFGIGTYIKNLIRYIPACDELNQYVIFHLPADKDFIPQTGPNIRLIADNSPKYSIRELIALPIKMKKLRLDLFHAPHYTLPPVRPCKGIVTIHDVIHLKFPEYHPYPAVYYCYAKGMMSAAAKSAKKIITVSEYSKQDIVHHLGVSKEKIEVVYNGINRNTSKGSSLKNRNELYDRFGFSRKYILYLGNFMPHKNLDTLVKAYALLKHRHAIPHCLVLAGNNQRMRPTLQRLITEENLGQDIFLTGFVQAKWLPSLYTHADVFVYPSLCEGFGLQTLEAMAHHTPVAIASVSALPEIAGNAAIRFEPQSDVNMAETIYTALTDSKLRTRLVENGNRRIHHFSWKAMAKKTVAIYKSVIRKHDS